MKVGGLMALNIDSVIETIINMDIPEEDLIIVGDDHLKIESSEYIINLIYKEDKINKENGTRLFGYTQRNKEIFLRQRKLLETEEDLKNYINKYYKKRDLNE